MKKAIISIFAALLVLPFAGAQESKPQLKWYGFIRNYYTFDTRESVAGTEDFFYYIPKDEKIVDGVDLNASNTFRFAALTSRLGLDVLGYEYQGWKMGAKIEADFYAGLSGSTGTATFRLRQAYATVAKNQVSFKLGQAWHPLAADMPDVFSLNSGAPFNPFSRTPLVSVDWKFAKAFSLSAAAIWQMQYVSAGPKGGVGGGTAYSADYIKYGCTPELYFGLNYSEDGLLARVGVDVLSIKPRRLDVTGTRKVSDRITTVSPYAYLQYTKGAFTAKAKTTYAQGGEHLNLNGGYALNSINADGSWNYTPTRNSSSWLSVKYGKTLQGILFLGYVKNFGTRDEILSVADIYFSKNSFANMNSMYRITPAVVYNFGKLALGLEYELTSVQYGSWGDDFKYGLATKDLHWVTNNRVQAMVKFTF